MKQLLLLTLFHLIFLGKSQLPEFKINNLSFSDINELIIGEDPNYYYDDLLEKFEKGDSLNDQQKICLYYGAILQPNFQPFLSIPYENRINLFNNTTQYDRVISMTDTLLSIRPTSLMGNLERGFALRKVRENNQALVATFRFRQLKEAILLSGDGSSPEKAIIVTSIKDIDPILSHNRWAVKKMKEKEIDGTQFYIYKVFEKGKTKEVYFNVDLFFKFGGVKEY